MLSVKQLADEIGVSKQAVFKRINSEPLKSALADGITTQNRKLFLTEEAAEIVKRAFSKKFGYKKIDIEPDYQPAEPQAINLLINQLEIKDRQIAEMQEHINQLTDAFVHSQNTLTAKILELFNHAARLLPTEKKPPKAIKSIEPDTLEEAADDSTSSTNEPIEDSFDFPLRSFFGKLTK